MKLKPPIFVVGSPRSGTTLLYHLLISAGGVAVYRFEVQIFHYLAPMFGNFRTQRQRERFLRAWLPSEMFLRSGLDAREMSGRFLDECRSAGDCQRIFMDSIAAAQRAQRWADCTPENVLHMDKIQSTFPDALFIHMIRDGRDVALSLARQRWIRPFPWDRNRPFVPAGIYWAWILENRAQGHGLAPRYLEVHYRDLVQQPEETLSKISSFTDHPLDYERIQQVRMGTVDVPNTSFDQELDSGQFKSVDRWRSCRKRDLAVIESLIGPQLSMMGYELETHESHLVGRNEKLNCALYRTVFEQRRRLRTHTLLGEWFSNRNILLAAPANDISDVTLRPGHHMDAIRRIVSTESS